MCNARLLTEAVLCSAFRVSSIGGSVVQWLGTHTLELHPHSALLSCMTFPGRSILTRFLSLSCYPACLFSPFSKFNHPNILKQLGVCLLNEPQYIILELMEGGDLLTYLRKARMTSVGNGVHSIGYVMQMTYKFVLLSFKFNRLQFGLMVET